MTRSRTPVSDPTLREQSLINAYEHEEERIIIHLTKKLEQLRQEKIELENALEAESESHVNRLTKELTALRRQQLQSLNSATQTEPSNNNAPSGSFNILSQSESGSDILDAMRRENEQLRTKLSGTERDYVRVSRLNEIYREELIEHRRRQGLAVDNLIGLATSDPYSEPTHLRKASGSSLTSSPSAIFQPQQGFTRPTQTVPIPRPNSAIAMARPASFQPSSDSSASLSPATSPSSPSSPSEHTFSISYHPRADTSKFHTQTNSSSTKTTPPSSSAASLSPTPPAPWSYVNHQTSNTLTYPSVPPPSLSSSPIVATMRSREQSVSGSTRSRTIERGGRIAETGSLVRSGSIGR